MPPPQGWARWLSLAPGLLSPSGWNSLGAPPQPPGGLPATPVGAPACYWTLGPCMAPGAEVRGSHAGAQLPAAPRPPPGADGCRTPSAEPPPQKASGTAAGSELPARLSAQGTVSCVTLLCDPLKAQDLAVPPTAVCEPQFPHLGHGGPAPSRNRRAEQQGQRSDNSSGKMTMETKGKLRLRKPNLLQAHGWLARELSAPLPVLSPF